MSSATTASSAVVISAADTISNGFREKTPPCENGFFSKNDAKDYLVEIVGETITEDIPEDDDEEKESTNLVVAKVVEVQEDIDLSDCVKESRELILTNGYDKINGDISDNYKLSSEMLLNINKSEKQQLSNVDKSENSFVTKNCKNNVNNNSSDCSKDKNSNSDYDERKIETSLITENHISEHVDIESKKNNLKKEEEKRDDIEINKIVSQSSSIEEEIVNKTLSNEDSSLKPLESKKLFNISAEEIIKNNKEETKISTNSNKISDTASNLSKPLTEGTFSSNSEAEQISFPDSCEIITSKSISVSEHVDLSSELKSSSNENSASSKNVLEEKGSPPETCSISQDTSESIDGDNSIQSTQPCQETQNPIKDDETESLPIIEPAEKCSTILSRSNSEDIKQETDGNSTLQERSGKETECVEQSLISECKDSVEVSGVNKEAPEKSEAPSKAVLKRRLSTAHEGDDESRKKKNATDKTVSEKEKKDKKRKSSHEEHGKSEKKLRISSQSGKEVKESSTKHGIVQDCKKSETAGNSLKQLCSGKILEKRTNEKSSTDSELVVKKKLKKKEKDKSRDRDRSKHLEGEQNKNQGIIKSKERSSSHEIKNKLTDDRKIKEKSETSSKKCDENESKHSNKNKLDNSIKKKTDSKRDNVGELLIGESFSSCHDKCPLCSCDCKLKKNDRKILGENTISLTEVIPEGSNMNINPVKLEDLIGQRFADWITNRCDVGALRRRVHFLEEEHDRIIQLNINLKKQVEDAKCIMKRMIDEKIAQKSWAEGIIPLKVTRSVGMQVCTTGSAHVLIKPPENDKEPSCTSDNRLSTDSNKENERTVPSNIGSSSNVGGNANTEVQNNGVEHSQQNAQFSNAAQSAASVNQLKHQLLKPKKTNLPAGVEVSVSEIEDNDIEEIQVIESPAGISNSKNISKTSEVKLTSLTVSGKASTSTTAATATSTPTIYILKPSDVGIPSRNIRPLTSTLPAITTPATTQSATPITTAILATTASPTIAMAAPSTITTADSEVIDLTDNEPATGQNKRESTASNTSRLQSQIRFSTPQKTKLVMQPTNPAAFANKAQVVTFPADSTTTFVFHKPTNPPVRKHTVISTKERLLTAMSTLPPLPRSPKYMSSVPRPPKPVLRICKNTSGIMLSWNFDDHIPTTIKKYQVYAYQEGSPIDPSKSETWKKVGDVDALPLPMACTLTQFKEGHKYFFVVRAMDVNTRLGEFSLPGSIMLTTNARV